MNKKYVFIALLATFFSSYGIERNLEAVEPNIVAPILVPPAQAAQIRSGDLLRFLPRDLKRRSVGAKMSIHRMLNPSTEIPIYSNSRNLEQHWTLCSVPGCKTGVLTTVNPRVGAQVDNVRKHMRKQHPFSPISNDYFKKYSSLFCLAPQGVIKKRREIRKKRREIKEKNARQNIDELQDIAGLSKFVDEEIARVQLYLKRMKREAQNNS